MSAADQQRGFESLLYSLLSTEETISRRMAYPGKNTFSRYVFLIAENPEQLINSFKNIVGLTKMIGTGNEIVPLSQEEVNLLMRMGKDNQLVEMSSGIIKDNRIQILSGPLQGMEDSIRRIDRHKRVAYLEVEMFGRTVEMKAGLEIIKKEQKK